jgi:hypothetical protein
MNTSWRHHYIPKFYLKGFVNSAGFFYLYNKSTQRIERNPKAPESYFFERGRNTFEIPNGELDDFIETSFYKKFDNLSKYAFERLREGGVNSISGDARALSSIVQFINGLFYRIPKYDDFHNGQILSGNEKYLLPIYKGNHVDVTREYFESHKQDDLYRYACRFFLSLHGIVPVGTELERWTVIEFPFEKKNQYLLTCDCPLIVDDENNYNSGTELILAPLTQKHLAIRTNGVLSNAINTAELIYFVNLYLLANAQKYVCCSDQGILDFYTERKGNFDMAAIRSKVLSLIID